VPCEHLRKGVAVGVATGAELVLVGHGTGCGARAEQAASEARALLVRPVDEADRDGRLTFPGDAAEHLHSCDDVEGSVEPTPVRHGVDVAADKERAVGAAGEGEPLVPRLVGLLRDAEWLQLRGQPFAGPNPGVRPRDALRAVLVAGELSQLLQLLHSAARLKRHGGQLYKLPGLMGRGSRPLKRWRNDRQRKKKERDRRRATEKKTK
jgi:hypothetical protein